MGTTRRYSFECCRHCTKSRMFRTGLVACSACNNARSSCSIKDKQFAAALAELRTLPERQKKLEALCLQGLGDLRGGAQCHLADGNLKEALICYRAIPDLDEALKLVGEIGEHPAAEFLRWVAKLQRLVAERPEKFTKMVTPAEKKLLQELLEKALGVSRPKVAPHKPANKSAAPRRRVPEKTRDDGKSHF
jgi:hypothetical protein